MLKSTKEFRHFAEIVDDDHKIKYLKDLDFHKYLSLVEDSQQN